MGPRRVLTGWEGTNGADGVDTRYGASGLSWEL